jgi:hypothetical protein
VSGEGAEGRKGADKGLARAGHDGGNLSSDPRNAWSAATSRTVPPRIAPSPMGKRRPECVSQCY